jgi:hypothetical protein
MASVPLSSPPRKVPIVDAGGRLTGEWASWFTAVFNRLGGGTDKVEAAHTTAAAAAPQATQVVAVGGLHTGGTLTGNVAISFYRALGPAASLPTTGNGEGDFAYAYDGRKPGEGAGAGTGVPVWWTKAGWYAVTSGAAVTT